MSEVAANPVETLLVPGLLLFLVVYLIWSFTPPNNDEQEH